VQHQFLIAACDSLVAHNINSQNFLLD